MTLATLATSALAKASAASRAEKQLAKAELLLQAAWFDAVHYAKNLIAPGDLQELIAEAGERGVFKADELPEIAWNLAADVRILGQPHEIVEVDVARFDAAWQSSPFYIGDREAITDAVARTVRAGVYLPPPAVADTTGKGRWEIISGRNRYLYTRAAGHKTLPLAVPSRDAARLEKLAGLEPSGPARPQGGSVPAIASRPYADLSDAIAHVGAELGNRFFCTVVALALAVGEREGVRLTRMIASRARKAEADTIGIDFETPNFGALLELELSALGLIREITEEQQRVILEALRDGVERGVNPRQMAREFRQAIGLTEHQMSHVRSYRDALTRAHGDPSALANALGRELRDGRFDRTVARAARLQQALSREKIDQLVARYQERYIAHRAEVIARTQALRAVHMGEESVWQEAARRGDIVAEEVTETWHTRLDGRERKTHRAMNKQERRMGVPFTTGAGVALRFPGDPLAPGAETIQCRCVVTRQISAAPLVGTETDGVRITGIDVDSAG